VASDAALRFAKSCRIFLPHFFIFDLTCKTHRYASKGAPKKKKNTEQIKTNHNACDIKNKMSDINAGKIINTINPKYTLLDTERMWIHVHTYIHVYR